MKEHITIIGAGNLTVSILEALKRSRAKFTINVVDIDKKKSSRLKRFGVKLNTTYDDKISKSVISQANTRSKGFIEIQSGNPLIYYIIKNAMAAGISSYYIILSKNSDEFKSYLDKISQELKIQIKIAYQDFYGNEKPLGTADAICQTQDQYPELKVSRFLVCNSDNLYSENSFRTLVDSTDHCSMIAYKFDCLNFENERLRGFAILDIVDDFLNKIIEKPDQQTIDLFNSKGIYVSMNIFSFFGDQV